MLKEGEYVPELSTTGHVGEGRIRVARVDEVLVAVGRGAFIDTAGKACGTTNSQLLIGEGLYATLVTLGQGYDG